MSQRAAPFSIRRRFYHGIRRTIGKKRLIKNFQGILRLPDLPVLDTGTVTQIGNKDLNILTRTIAQSLSRQKMNKGLPPFDIKERTIRQHSVIPQALKASQNI